MQDIKKQELIKLAEEVIEKNTYVAEVLERVYELVPFNKEMLKYECDIALGKAFGAMEILRGIEVCDRTVYNKTIEQARRDIKKVNKGDIAELLSLIGLDVKDLMVVAIKRGRIDD